MRTMGAPRSLRWPVAAAAALAMVSLTCASSAEETKPRLTFADAIKRAMPSVVGIKVRGEEHVEENNAFYNHPVALSSGANPQASKTRVVGSIGSGVIVGAKGDTGYIVTNF